MKVECIFKGFVKCCPGEADQTASDTSTLTEVGIPTLERAAESRGDDLTFTAGLVFHKKCRQEYTNRKSLESKRKSLDQENEVRPAKSPRVPLGEVQQNSTTVTDDDSEGNSVCFLCSFGLGSKNRNDNNVNYATSKLKLVIPLVANVRDDAWGHEVHDRLKVCRSATSYYHTPCLVSFVRGDARSAFCTERRRGQSKRDEAFQKVMESFLHKSRTERNHYATLQAMIDEMQEELQESESNEEPYCKKSFLSAIKERYSHEVIASEGIKPCIVIAKNVLMLQIKDLHAQAKTKPQVMERECKISETIKVLVKKIRHEMEDLKQDMKQYPKVSILSDADAQMKCIPPTLKEFLQQIFSRKNVTLQVVAIGQAIMQVSMPRSVIEPIMWALGCTAHHEYRSRDLVMLLHACGFSISYEEVMCYEANAAMATALVNMNPTEKPDFIAFAADNLDHDRITLDGHNSFHGMGIIAAVSPKMKQSSTAVVMRNKVTLEDLRNVGTVPIKVYTARPSTFDTVKFQVLRQSHPLDPDLYADILWKVAYFFKRTRPNWNGMMQKICNSGAHPGPSSRMYLPIIDLNPNDKTCLFSTLLFVLGVAQRHGVDPVLTFDQPLFWKASSIVADEPEGSELKKMILLLGPFHTRMSFLGTIGAVMKGSGLEQVIAQIIAPNAVKHILSGKAVARAERVHFLIESALYKMIMEAVFEESALSDQRCCDTVSTHNSQLLQELVISLEGLLDGAIPEVTESPIFSEVHDILESTKKELAKNSRTSKLWLQYLQMIGIYRAFRKGEVTGDLDLHLTSLSAMLPFFAASGHNNYLKSAWLYLQRMAKLSEEHPKVYEAFKKGLFVVRRVDEFWGAVGYDLFIEQDLMKYIKSRGGITRAGGLTESQRLLWLLARPLSGDISCRMKELSRKTSDGQKRNVDASSARVNRDDKDTQAVYDFLQSAKVFSGSESLRSLATGMEAQAGVNADEAEKVGQAIVGGMVGKCVGEMKFSRKNQVVTLDMAPTVTDDKSTHYRIEPLALFQRCILIARGKENFPAIFMNELSPIPLALFDAPGLLREPNKSSMKDAVLSLGGGKCILPLGWQNNFHSVLDGGSLLQTIRWKQQKTYLEVVRSYLDYVKVFGGRVSAVFDGYASGASTKDVAHARRYGNFKRVSSFSIQPHKIIGLKQEEFLANSVNKSRFIALLSDHLSADGHFTETAADDADFYVCAKGIHTAEETPTLVIAEDTDILILLIHHLRSTSKDVYMIGHNAIKDKSFKALHINEIRHRLGPNLSGMILFLHAFLGCDTTSRLFGIRRDKVLEMARNSQEFFAISMVFLSRSSTADEVRQAGISAFLLIYGGAAGESLWQLRHRKFALKAANKAGKAVVPQNLPPTEDAAGLHAMRVYYQVQTWVGNESLRAVDWGWKEENGRLVPQMMTAPPAPEYLITLARCKCKGDCSTNRCSCRQFGLKCEKSCAECTLQGTNCTNLEPEAAMSREDEEEVFDRADNCRQDYTHEDWEGWYVEEQ